MITSDQLMRMKNERVFFLHCPIDRPERATREKPLDVIVQCSFTPSGQLDRNFFRGGGRQAGGLNTIGDPALRARFGERVGLWVSSKGLAAMTDNRDRNVVGPFTRSELQQHLNRVFDERKRRNFFGIFFAKKSQAEIDAIVKASVV